MFQKHVGTVRDESEVRVLARCGIVAHDVGALAAGLRGFVAVFAGERVHHLAGKDESRRAVVVLESHFPCGESFECICRTEHEHFGLAVFLREVFEQADLRFVFDGLVRRAVFAHAEAIVREHVLDRQAHEGGHADSGLHEVAEHEERGANREQALLQRDTVHDGTHRKFCNAHLDERALEVVSAEDARLVEERLRVVGVGEVGGTANDVVEVFGEVAEHRTARNAGSHAFLDGEAGEVEHRSLAGEPFIEGRGLLGICLVPGGLGLLPFGDFLAEFFGTGFKCSLHIVEHLERVVRVTAEVLDRRGCGSTGSVERLAVRRNFAFVALAVFGDGALRHRGVAEHERRLFLLGPGFLESLAEFGDVGTVAFDNAETPSLVLADEVVAHHVFGLATELHLVRVVEEDEVRKLEVARNAAHAVSNFFFEAAVRNEADRLVLEDGAEAFHHEAFGDGGAKSDAMADTERARGVLDAEHHVQFGVTRSAAAELAEVLHVVEVEAAGKHELGVQERAHVARVHEEAVATHPFRIVRVVAQEFRKQKRRGVGGAHRATRMPGLRLLHHRGRKDSDVVGCFRN